MRLTRRRILVALGSGGGGLLVSTYAGAHVVSVTGEKPTSEQAKGGEVTATEDLMREHGVLRRVLFVYSEAADRLRANHAAPVLDSLQKSTKLFRAFGEDYHEKQLEEAYIFPAVKKAGRDAAGLPDILLAQHNRGREITDYILAVTRQSKLEDGGESLAQVLESFVRMYRAHAAREDTVVFPAWKMTLTAAQLDQMNDKFEDIEHEMLGENGFEKAVDQISDIEGAMGLADLAQFTAPRPSVK
jgi:hemerythrin-like domain-containing protein